MAVDELDAEYLGLRELGRDGDLQIGRLGFGSFSGLSSSLGVLDGLGLQHSGVSDDVDVMGA
jgi:hypothetical protein